VAGGEFEVNEGKWLPHHLAPFKLPDRQSIRNFFFDPDFSEIAAKSDTRQKRSSLPSTVLID
jgi:uncharacterized protein (DUF1330 family)